MRKINIITAIAAAITLTTPMAFAAEDMEKCKVIKQGKGLIKKHKADCKGAGHSCAGQNVEGDPESWIYVPKGLCEKINAGDFNGVPSGIKDKIKK